MKNKRSYIYAFLFVFIIVVSYFAYRIYRVIQLNVRLEKFMAGQIVPIQDQRFDNHQRPKPKDYFIYRNEGFWIDINQISIEEGNYNSYWMSRDGHQQQVTEEDYNKEQEKYIDGTIDWMYTIRPVSVSTVCVMLEAHKPRSWTAGGMGSVAGSIVWTIDTSKDEWQLETHDSWCRFEDTNLPRILLLTVQ